MERECLFFECVCVLQGLHSLRDILYKPLRFSHAQQQALNQFLLREKEKYIAAETQEGVVLMTNGEDNKGFPVSFKSTQSVQLSLALAALKLLRLLHAQGWVHGDTHLGNFIYLDGRVYLIDCERSFPCECPTQHLLDIQEAFGHISGILVHPYMQNDWDMRDIQALYFCRHPLFKGTPSSTSVVPQSQNKRKCLPSPLQRRLGVSARRSTLFMLPVCSCFTSPTQAIRLRGCALCAIPMNRQSAAIFAGRSDEILEDMENWGFNKMRTSLFQTRQDCTQKCAFVASVIHPCIQDGSLLTESDGLQKPGSHVLKLPVKELIQDKVSCCSVLKRLLYAPAVCQKSMAMAKLFHSKLHNGGHVEAARVFWLYVAWNYQELSF